MEFGEVVRRRRMVRAYDPDRPVPEEVVTRALEHATRSPSAGFSQGWDFVVLTTEQERERFWSAATSAEARERMDPWLRGVRSAPCLVVCLSDKEAYLERYAEPDKGRADRDEAHWPVPYWDVDTGMAALLMLLTAVDEGLGGLFFGVPAEHGAQTVAALGAPAGRRIVGVVAMGYAASDRDRRSPSLRRGRRPVSEVAHRGAYGRPWVGGEVRREVEQG
ncbi:MAG: nitroreductase [Arsenicicoccus sp.]|nr:MAG: nitroreductase [Arsenicicoccus sp.]